MISEMSSQAVSLAHHIFSSHLSDHLAFALWLSGFALFVCRGSLSVLWTFVSFPMFMVDVDQIESSHCIILDGPGSAPVR